MSQRLEVYKDNLLFQRSKAELGPIEKNRGVNSYTGLLIIGKCLYAVGIFLAYGTLKSTSIVHLLFSINFCSSLIYVILQRPFSSGKRVKRTQWKVIIVSGVCSTLLTLLWVDALTLCGSIRTILLVQHSDAAILAILGILFQKGAGFPAKVRGAWFFVFGICCLFFFDHDEIVSRDGHPEGDHIGVAAHYYYQITSWLGLPDHKSGIVMLLLAVIGRVFYNNHFKKLAVDLGGTKRLRALVSCVETSLLLPWIILGHVLQESNFSLVAKLPTIILITLFVFVGDFYIESLCSVKLDNLKANRYGSMTCFLVAVSIGFLWNYIPVFALAIGVPDIHQHSISGGVIFATLFFLLATKLLTQPNPVKPGTSKGTLIGYSTSGLPLYSFSGPGGGTPQSPIVIFKQYLRRILESSESRNIFFYLCLNLIFTGVELTYGVWTNSLGLISDGFHMLFDCSALVFGLWASLMSRWKATKTFSYGYGRVEILAGFVNGLFLVVIAFFVFIAALKRLMDPPTVNTEKLMTVSVAGFVVNMIGIFAFSHAHAHSHGGGKSCDHGSDKHGHSHHGHSHQKKHSHKKHSTKSTNLQGVFLHVVADTLGSVGVIVSSFFIEQYKFYIADPLCSLFISILIFLSVLPLLKRSSHVLLQKTPEEIEEPLKEAFHKILSVDGVLSYKDHHFWRHSADTIAGTIHIQCMPNANEHKILQQVTGILKEHGVNNLTVQIEKEAFYHHLNRISSGHFGRTPFPVERMIFNLEDQNVIKSI